MNRTRVLALLLLFFGLANSFSWDIFVGDGGRLKFYYNGALEHTEDIPGVDDITSVIYDPVHYRVLFADYHNTNKSISSFDLSTQKVQSLFTRITSDHITSLAYDPVTQLLFWLEGRSRIYSLTLKPASSNKAVDGNLLVSLAHACGAIAVDSCRGFIYWATDYEIERAAFDGSKREVLIHGSVFFHRSLVIDQQAEKMYWIEETTFAQFSIKSADLNGNNRKTNYVIGTDSMADALAVSKDFIYWRSYSQGAIFRLRKNKIQDEGATFYSQSSRDCWWCQITAANYTIEEQTLGIKSCEALKSLIPDMEERPGSICHNYCFQGNCSVSAEGHPKCSCNRGYFGERCEVDACYKHCFNDGVCSLNEAEKPVCQCTADYQGERCDLSVCKDYCLEGNCSVSSEGQPRCSCNRGYSGERCEIDACHKHCFNNGVCSMNEVGNPVCQCTADYQGERCDVFICKDYCLEGNCSISTEGQRTCSCNRGYSGERCDVSICKDYCLEGNCSVSSEGQPTCSCNAGYSGGRCEVNACHSYCLHNGECSLNEEDEPVCQCTADYEGERCDVATTLTDVCVCSDKSMTQLKLRNLHSKLKQVISEELQCTL